MRLLRYQPQLIFSILLGVGCIASIVWYARNQERHFHRLYTIKAGVLYRSGQLTHKGLLRVIYEKNIGTVINLCDSTTSERSIEWEENLCTKNFTYFLPITADMGKAPDRSPAASEQIVEEAVRKFLDIMSDPVTYPRPVLIHCKTGIHRTGVMAALFRMECQGWSREQAIAEMCELGYRDFSSCDPLRDLLLNWKPQRVEK